jgi:hypothetical protein
MIYEEKIMAPPLVGLIYHDDKSKTIFIELIRKKSLCKIESKVFEGFLKNSCRPVTKS